MRLTQQQIASIAQSTDSVDYASLMAFIMTESGGNGFDLLTGKVIIRFEMSWFVRKLTAYGIAFTTSGNTLTANDITVIVNHRGQADEWVSFNAAWKISQKCAMLSTSWGMMQVMGFNYATCGFDSVDDFVTAMRSGELAQVQAAANFILHNRPLLLALQTKNWQMVAYYYNGSAYKENNYDGHLQANYNKYSS